jgi:hypothetical protein
LISICASAVPKVCPVPSDPSEVHGAKESGRKRRRKEREKIDWKGQRKREITRM